jgi:hypothetical protein
MHMLAVMFQGPHVQINDARTVDIGKEMRAHLQPNVFLACVLKASHSTL